jgi:hypothetical protein
MPSIPLIFPVRQVQETFEADGRARDLGYERRIGRLEELEWYTRALKQARTKDPCT